MWAWSRALQSNRTCRRARHPDGMDLGGTERRTASGGWERSGNRGRSCERSSALSCSLVRGVHLRKDESALVAGMWMHSWGSRGRRFKSGRPNW